MVGYILRRIAFAIPTLILVSIGIFLMVRLLPGLNGSYAEQYWRWISGVMQGDFGFSLRNAEPVSNIVFDAMTVTLELVILALLIATLVGVPLGVLSAVKRDTGWDLGARVGGLVGLSVPSFWLATLLLLFTSRAFGWVPPLVYISPFDDPIGNLSQFILPALSIPVVTIIGFEIGVLIGGAAIIETIFGLPGVGYVLLQAIFGRDYPVIQAMTLLIAFTFIFANLLVDLLYGVLDPRISQE